MNKLLVLMFFIPAMAYANFALSSVDSIECKDSESSRDVEVFFTTSSPGAQKYTRRADTIPYEYGNSRAFNFGTGQMVLNNNPDTEAGVISLVDSYDRENPVTLVLTPSVTMSLNAYEGVLSGQTETQNGWKPIQNRKMRCIVTPVTAQFFTIASKGGNCKPMANPPPFCKRGTKALQCSDGSIHCTPKPCKHGECVK